jgi:hypothetical protein
MLQDIQWSVQNLLFSYPRCNSTAFAHNYSTITYLTGGQRVLKFLVLIWLQKTMI